MKGAMAENAEEKEMPGEGREDAAESPHPAEPQSEAELEKLIDKELEDVGKEDGVRNSTISQPYIHVICVIIS